jgi:hypothetical protein
MAKSKLYAKTYNAVGRYAELYDELIKEVNQGSISDNTLSAMNSQATVVRAAFAEADQHFKDLERRMGPDKTVGDRLRNLKNVFKDSAQLAAARKQVSANLDQCLGAFDTVERLTTMLTQHVRGQGA